MNRNRYPQAMAATCAIIRLGAEELPWLITELQGGNNTLSGQIPLCPTKEEIIQWLWIMTGFGGKGGIFWCFNPRVSGFEAGEWAMVDFRNRITDRLDGAGDVAAALTKEDDLFSHARPVHGKVSLLYSRESLRIEK